MLDLYGIDWVIVGGESGRLLDGRTWDELPVVSLQEGSEHLRIKPDGTVLQGNHRIKVLEERGYDTSELYGYAEVVEQE